MNLTGAFVFFPQIYHSGDQTLSPFDIDFPPTAQSTPVVNRSGRTQQQQQAVGATAASSASSLLTTPNNSGVDVSAMAASASANGDVIVAQKSVPTSGRESPVRDGHRLSEAPRTPTPFKRALADVYQRREPLSRTVRTCYPCGSISIASCCQLLFILLNCACSLLAHCSPKPPRNWSKT